MRLVSLCNVVPDAGFSQRECWELLKRSQRFGQLKRRSRAILEKVLLGDSGIEKRHFAMPEPGGLFDLGAGELNAGFEREAPALGARALDGALRQAGLRGNELDALIVCTCTGYLCPGLSSFIGERLSLRADAALLDLVGLGCGAAIPTLGQAARFIAAQPTARVAVVAVEICSAAFYLDDDPGVLISLCLFGDGASASIWDGQSTAGWRVSGFRSLHRPDLRDLLRFENANGFLRNRLAREVPQQAAEAVNELWLHSRHREGATPRPLVHPGGRDVIDAIVGQLGLADIPESRAVLRLNGNMSSPSILFAVGQSLSVDSGAEARWTTSFGAGFSAHACRWEWSQ